MSKPSSLYDVNYDQGTVKLKNKKCSRCGRTMAKHLKPNARWACGYCGYTEFIRTQ